MFPLWLSIMNQYSYAHYRDACNQQGYRVWRDEDLASSSTEIYDQWAMNLGGHDLLGHFLKHEMQGNGPTGWQNSGGLVVSRVEMLSQLQAMGVPSGVEHKLAAKAHHAGYTGATDDGAILTFTIDTGYTDFTEVSHATTPHATAFYDIAYCACWSGQDCPSPDW